MKEKKSEKKNLRILSGVNPSSSKGLHIGNYLGAIQPHVQFQERGDCYYFIADYHALNTVHDPKEFYNNTYEIYVDYMACGIDLNKTTFFVESHVPTIFELTEILKNVVTLGQMQRMHAYKDKLQDQEAAIESINMGLFNYPILMAADILLFAPDIVPVGEDQVQHVEVARDIAQSFNRRYGDVLKVPELFVKKESARVVGTDGSGRKMSKSLGNFLSIFAEEEIIRKQIMGITTDPNRINKNDPGNPEKNPIFNYMKMMEYDLKDVESFESQYREGAIGDVELKKKFFDFYMEYFKEIRDKRDKISADKESILKIMKENCEKANLVADENIKKVREAIGAFSI